MRQRLCEVPYLARDGEFADRMRDRERLPKMRSPYSGVLVLLFCDQAIYVEMKTKQVVTQEDGRALDKSAEIEFRRRAGIQPPKVLAGNRWPLLLTSGG